MSAANKSGTQRVGGRELLNPVKIIGGQLYVPAITAVRATKSDDISRLETLVGGIGDEMTPTAAVNANNGFGCTHEVTVS